MHEDLMERLGRVNWLFEKTLESLNRLEADHASFSAAVKRDELRATISYLKDARTALEKALDAKSKP